MLQPDSPAGTPGVRVGAARNDEERGGDQIARKPQEDHTARPHTLVHGRGTVV